MGGKGGKGGKGREGGKEGEEEKEGGGTDGSWKWERGEEVREGRVLG